MGKLRVFRLYIPNFTSELLHHRPKYTSHVDVRTAGPTRGRRPSSALELEETDQ
jgi:hypothetical protein